MKKENRVKEIAIVGGPGGGKTSLFDYLAKELPKRKIRGFVVEECATKFIKGGIPDIAEIAEKDPKKYIEIERQMLLTHLADRKNVRNMADVFGGERGALRCAIFCDRGGMDVKSYLPGTPENIFEAILEEERLTLWDVRDSYDAVIYLRSAALGAEKYYTTTNNPARQEKNLCDARAMDERTLRAWIGHPHLKIIESRENFEEKKKRALQAILNVIGDPYPVEIERKFLLKSKPNFFSRYFQDGRCAKVTIEQMYLEDGKRIRRASQNGYNAYCITEKIPIKGLEKKGKKKEIECSISALDYIYLSEKRDPRTSIIKKERRYFVWENQYLELDVFHEPKELCMLERELIDENDRVRLPSFLDIAREVTGNKKYSNHNIARGL